jgi:hypothetical protein
LARILWAPFFFDFVPQQSEAIWVLPHIRTTLSAFLYIYGFFLMAILLSSAYVHSKSLQSWITFKLKPMDLYDCINGVADTVRRYIQPADPIRGMVALGLASLLIIAGASWVHWTIPVDKVWISLLFATIGAILFALAVLFRARVEFWFGLIGLFLAWMVAWASQVITLPSDIFLPMGLGLFTLLWLAAFFHMGIAVKTRGDRKLSYSYLLIGLFFLLLAGIEVFAVKEYLGGDLMRTNTVFKFGIVAWELAAICAGVFFPKVFKVFKDLVAAPKKETEYFRMVMGLFAGLMVFIPVRLFTSTFLDDSASQLVLLMDLVFLAATLGWGYYTGKLSPVWAGVLGVLGAPFFVLPMFQSSLGLLLDIFRHWGGVFAVDFFFPAAISLAVVGSVIFLNERQKNVGRELAFKTWKMVVVMLLVMVSLYPILASKRKAHWFWSDFKQHPTLNGLAYIVSESPFDGAAIRFLNERIPGQPCLVEFVGMGYNTWGSRFSIFTGIPALMGWDGHVREWLTGRPGSEAAISERFNATELIYRTTDIAQAKKALDDHGVRLIMVGSVERHGAPGVRGPYPPEGLAKFAKFLPLIYKNPEVEIYYNPPGNSAVQ